MNIIIRNSSDEPIYMQIKEQIKEAIICGKLQEDEQLPSIRLLAKELRVSVITTKRAYDELESEGFLHSVQGKGSFVAPQNLEFVREGHLRDMEEALQKALYHAKMAGIEKSDVIKSIDLLQM